MGDRREPKGNTPVEGDYIAISMVTMADPATDTALSLALSPEDTLLDMSLSTTADGGIAFDRTKHRLGGGKTVQFAMDLVGHAADWRGGLGWMVHRYPQYFDPVNPKADAMAGCGAYSGCEDPVDVARLKQMAFRINWKLSDDFPYMGMFLPPLKTPDDRWDRSGDEPCPPNKPKWASFRRLNDYARICASRDSMFSTISMSRNSGSTWTLKRRTRCRPLIDINPTCGRIRSRT